MISTLHQLKQNVGDKPWALTGKQTNCLGDLNEKPGVDTLLLMTCY